LRCVTHTAFACITCEDVLKPLAGPMGALGISSETSADLGKERRTATKTPPGEMLMAVANSKESLPSPSRVRIKTGMASCNRAHLRSSFFDNLRGTCLHHPLRGIHTPRPHLRGQTSDGSRHCFESLQTSPPTGRLPKCHHRLEISSDCRSGQESATFFASVPVLAPFPIDSRLHLT
jgi:hypothetical protein